MEISGTVVKVLPPTSGTSQSGKDWTKQTFVIEFTEGNYDKQLAFDTLKPEILKGIGEGSAVDVKFNIESREYNGKYYTNCNAWAVKEVGKVVNTLPAKTAKDDDLPW